MTIIQNVHCPNCGSWSERFHFPLLAQVKTECRTCDYLMVMCSRTGRVIESQAPGINSESLSLKQKLANPTVERVAELYHDKLKSSNQLTKSNSCKDESLVSFKSSMLRRVSLYSGSRC